MMWLYLAREGPPRDADYLAKHDILANGSGCFLSPCAKRFYAFSIILRAPQRSFAGDFFTDSFYL